MARAMRAATHLTPMQIDMVIENAERAALIELCRSSKKTIFLKGGPGGDTGGLDQSKLVGSPVLAECIARAVLPFTDLLVGAPVAYNQWLTAALVAGALQNYCARLLTATQVVTIYGVATLSGNPAIGYARCLSGSVVMAAWDLTNLWAAQDTMGFADEAPLWSTTETVTFEITPFLNVAGGEVFVLMGIIAEPKGTGPVTK